MSVFTLFNIPYNASIASSSSEIILNIHTLIICGKETFPVSSTLGSPFPFRPSRYLDRDTSSSNLSFRIPPANSRALLRKFSF